MLCSPPGEARCSMPQREQLLVWQTVALLNLPQAQARYQSEQVDSIVPGADGKDVGTHGTGSPTYRLGQSLPTGPLPNFCDK